MLQHLLWQCCWCEYSCAREEVKSPHTRDPLLGIAVSTLTPSSLAPPYSSEIAYTRIYKDFSQCFQSESFENFWPWHSRQTVVIKPPARQNGTVSHTMRHKHSRGKHQFPHRCVSLVRFLNTPGGTSGNPFSARCLWARKGFSHHTTSNPPTPGHLSPIPIPIPIQIPCPHPTSLATGCVTFDRGMALSVLFMAHPSVAPCTLPPGKATSSE